MAEVVTFGEVMAMLVASEAGPLEDVDRFDVRLAGAEMNVAVGLARLGHRVRYLGAVGDDPFGARARRTLAAEGIDISALAVSTSAPTGFQLKNRVQRGDPAVVYFRRGSAAAELAWTPELERAVSRARHLHVTGIFPALAPHTHDITAGAMRAARRAGATVSFDPNLRPSLWTDETSMIAGVNELAALADCVLPGLAEGRRLTGRETAAGIAEHYRARGAAEVVVKSGSRGASAHGRRGSWHAPACPVRVVDTVGAGDGFAAGWISARISGADEPTALRRACAVGALATTSEGDMDGLPTPRMLEQLLDEAPGR